MSSTDAAARVIELVAHVRGQDNVLTQGEAPIQCCIALDILAVWVP